MTLLFADLAGYTALCHRWDPEDVHLLVRPLMNALRAVCEELGAVVPVIEGDGFMAAFGARTAAEDDPARALRAAVEMQQVLTSRREVMPAVPALHVGLHLGEVVVAPSWEQTGLSLAGDAVNVARRLSSCAEPGEVLVSTELAGLTGVTSGWEAPRHLELEGRPGRVAAQTFAWERVGESLRSSRWPTSSPYVSRPAVEQQLSAALAGSQGVLVTGEAGVGKTRLVAAVLADRPVVFVSCSAARYPEVRGLVASVLQALDGATPSRDALVRLLRGAGPGEIEGGGEEALLAAAARLVAAASPTPVVVLDDAERLPPGEVMVLAQVLRAVMSPWVVVSREPLALRVPQVHIPFLELAESSRLVDVLLPGASIELRSTVLRRAGDSPLYLEQCARLLVETGAVAVHDGACTVVAPDRLRAVPASMRLFVSSRLDVLDEREREVLGVAAVLGDTPDVDLLRHLTGDVDGEVVERLVARGHLRWVQAGQDGPALTFSHALVRDVAYQTMLRSRRAFLHTAAADWYAVLPVSHVLEAQAYHFEQAVRLEEPDCGALRRAVEAMVLFARSIEEERTRVSREVLERARELAERRAECAVDFLQLELAAASVHAALGDAERASGSARRAQQLASDRSDGHARAQAELVLGRLALAGLDVEGAEDHLTTAALLFHEAGDVGGEARVAVERAFAAQFARGAAQFLGHLEQAYKLALRSADLRLQASAAQQLALHHAIATGRDEFALWSTRAVEVSRSDDVGLVPRLDLAHAVLAMADLDAVTGLAPATRALTEGRELGLWHVHTNAVICAADLLLLSGRLEQLEVVLREGHALAGRRPTAWLRLQLELIEARAALRAGDPDRAALLLAGVAGHDLAGQQVMHRDLLEARAWVSLERGAFEQARALAAQSVLLAQETGEACVQARPRLVELQATVAQGDWLPIGDIAALKNVARDAGLSTIGGLASRWLYVDELAHGWSVDLHGLEECPVVEARALDLEIEALSTRSFDRLFDAAEVWAELGTTVWQARALLWHSELTGVEHEEADRLLEVLQSPAGLAEKLRAQVRALKG